MLICYRLMSMGACSMTKTRVVRWSLRSSAACWLTWACWYVENPRLPVTLENIFNQLWSFVVLKDERTFRGRKA